MFNPIFGEQPNEVFLSRLRRLEQQLRGLTLSTREDFQAEVYSRLNAILARGNRTSALQPVPREGPAVVGQVSENLSILNNDAQDIVAQMLSTEDEAAKLYNLAALTQDALRQRVRERIFASTLQSYVLPFINDNDLEKTTASLDFAAGMATLPVLEEVEIMPTDTQLGPWGGDPSLFSPGHGLEALFDGKLETVMVWPSGYLEIILSFAEPQIINRIRFEQDDYRQLTLQELSTTTVDGVFSDNIVSELFGGQPHLDLAMDCSSGKFGGDFIVDFSPRCVRQLRLAIYDPRGGQVALRALHIYRRKYAKSAQVQTRGISLLPGSVRFSSQERVPGPLVSIAHLLSFDGISYQALQPGQILTLADSPTTKIWYRTLLDRHDLAIAEQSGPLLSVRDPNLNDDYRVSQTTTVDIGGNLVERTIAFESIDGPVTFQDVPLATGSRQPGSATDSALKVWEGAVLLSPSSYSFLNNVLSFSTSKSNITVRYQTSAAGTAGLETRKDFYSPYLFEARFERVA